MTRSLLPITITTALALSLSAPAAQAKTLAPAPAALLTDDVAKATTVVKDDFHRAPGKGWGTAPTGGSWTTWGDAYLEDSNVGVLMNQPNTGQGARLDAVTERDHETEIVLRAGDVPTADLFVTFAHRDHDGSRYETRLVFRTNATVDMQLVARTPQGEEVLATSERDVVSFHPGKEFTLRFAAVGEGTTELGASLWPTGTTAPTTWDISATDDTPQLQQAGTFGVETWLGGATKRTSIKITDWTSQHVDVAVPEAAPAPTPSPEPSQAPAPTPAPEQEPATQGTTPAGLADGGDLAEVPASSTGAGAVPLGETNYPVPADAIHVKAGADTSVANGSAETPFASIQKAVWNAKQGQTIVVHDGVYHEYVGIFNDPKWNTYHNSTTIQAAPGAEVWLDGSKELTDWTRSGTTWTVPWSDDENFNTVAGFGSTDETGDLAFVGKRNPLAADSSQVFVNGHQLEQVAANPGAGQFAVDRTDPANKKIVLGEDPTGKEVRASSLHQAIVSNVDDLTLRGIGVRGYATPLNWMGSVYLFGQRPTVENMVFDSLPTVPLNFSGASEAVVRSNTSVHAGLNGFGAHRADGAEFSNNYVYGANQQRFNAAPVAAGVKVTQMQDMEFSGNEITATDGATGLWVDESVVNFSVTDNRFANNGSLGVHVEISACAIVAGNEIVDNRGSGIEVLGTPYTWVANNYIAGNGANGSANISVLQDARRQADGGMGIDPRHPEPDPINTWITSEVRVVNNVLGAPHSNSRGQFDVHDRAGESYADRMLAQVAGNVMVDAEGENFARLGTPGHTSKTYADYASVERNHGEIWGPNAIVTGGTRAELEKRGDDAKGVPLDGAVAELLGLPAGTTHVGMP